MENRFIQATRRASSRSRAICAAKMQANLQAPASHQLLWWHSPPPRCPVRGQRTSTTPHKQGPAQDRGCQRAKDAKPGPVTPKRNGRSGLIPTRQRPRRPKRSSGCSRCGSRCDEASPKAPQEGSESQESRAAPLPTEPRRQKRTSRSIRNAVVSRSRSSRGGAKGPQECAQWQRPHVAFRSTTRSSTITDIRTVRPLVGRAPAQVRLQGSRRARLTPPQMGRAGRLPRQASGHGSRKSKFAVKAPADGRESAGPRHPGGGLEISHHQGSDPAAAQTAAARPSQRRVDRSNPLNSMLWPRYTGPKQELRPPIRSCPFRPIESAGKRRIRVPACTTRVAQQAVPEYAIALARSRSCVTITVSRENSSAALLQQSPHPPRWDR